MNVALPSASTPTSFRADIQGLRAVAVVLVVANHSLGWPFGGFVGVDVFYVISGFLITGLLLRELERTGSISLRAFYARRVRRIVPAAVVVLVVTSVTAFALWFTPRALQAFTDAVSAAVFVSNWHFIALRVDYLQADAAVSPFQHYWSLSIEEQFYAAWPLLFLLLFAVARGARKWLGAVVGVLLVASLAWAAARTSGAPAAAYFDTFARAWELLAGAALAVLGTAPRRLGDSGRRVVAGVGLALIVVGSVLVGPQWPVPFPWVGPAVLGTAVVIWADASAGPRSVLGNRVAQWLGQASYSLYLWHFPVIVFAESVFGRSLLVGAACLPVMLGLSELSRRYVEQPALRGRFLSRAAKATNRRRFVGRDLVLGAAALALVVELSASQLSGPEALRSADSIARLAGVPHFAGDGDLPSAEQRTQQVQAALAASAWPESTRTQLDRLFSLQGPEAMLAKAPGCRNSVQQTSPTLICGEADVAGGAAGGGVGQGGGAAGGAGQGAEALVVGDSVALSWVPAVQTAAGVTGWRVRAVGFANCPLVDVPASNWARDPAFEQGCTARRAELIALIGARRPAVVFLSAAQGAMVSSGLEAQAAAAAWQAGLERTLAALAALPEAPRVVVLSNPPVAAHPLTCSNRLSSPASCISEVGGDYAAKASAERAAVAKFSDAFFVDTASWFCADGRCPAFIGDQVVRLDGVHLTEAAARAVGTLLIDSSSSRR